MKHLRKLNSGPKCLNVTLKLIKFSKPEEINVKKIKLRGQATHGS
jgi:hypothetical protein